MQVHEIQDKLIVTWDPGVRAIIDTWTDYGVSLQEFRFAVLEQGLGHATKNGGVAWVVDSTGARGAFTQDIQAFIGSDVFPAFQKAGIKYFITTVTKSAVTKMAVKRFQAKTGPYGLTLVEVETAADARTFLLGEGRSAAGGTR